MARFTAAWRTTGAGSATLPNGGLMAQAGVPMWLIEVSAINTAAVAVIPFLRRIVTAAGTAGAAQTVNYEESDTATTRGNPVDTWTVAPTFAAGAIRPGVLGASIGSGWAWTFGGRGLFIPAGTTNGMCVVPLSGTGQILDLHFSWDA